MSAIGRGDWVQVVHAVEHERATLRVGDVHCIEAVDIPPRSGEVWCAFDGCQDAGFALVGVGGGVLGDCFFCSHRFKPLGGNGATADRRELTTA